MIHHEFTVTLTPDDIKLYDRAKEAGFAMENSAAISAAERFVKLVAAAEREACAKVCEERIEYWQRDDNRRDEDEQCADAIRARGQA
jgi:hypothetical protein